MPRERPVSRTDNAPARVLSTRKDEIADLAQIVADEHCPVGPVDPNVVAHKKNITLSYGRYEDAFDGLLARVHHGLSARIAIRSEFAVFEGSDRMKMLEMRGFDGFSEM